jgi:PAS domain S-box-containing protein
MRTEGSRRADEGGGWRAVSGLVVTGAVVGALAFGERLGLKSPTPSALLVLAVGYAVFVGNVAIGAASAVVALLFYALFEHRGPLAVASTGVVLAFEVGGIGYLKRRLSEVVRREQTAREDAERERRRATTILESIADGFATVDEEWRLVYMNGRAEELARRPRSEVIGRRISDEFPSLAGTPFEAGLRRAAAERGHVRFELHDRRTDRWVEVDVYPSEEGFAILVRSIDERRRAEAAMRGRALQVALAELGVYALSRERLADVLDEAVRIVAEVLHVELVAVLELRPARRLVHRAGIGWRPGLVGFEEIAPGSASMAAFTLASGAPVVVEDLAAETRFAPPAILREHEVVSGLNVGIGPADRPFGVLGAHSRTRRTFTPEELKFAQAVANVIGMAAERHRSEEALRESESRFREIAENVREVLLVADVLEGQVSYVNPAYEKLFGRSLASATRRPRAWLDRVHPEDRPRVEAAYADAADGGFDETFRVAHPDGEVRWLHGRFFPVPEPDGRIIRLVGLVEDVTLRRRAEDDARRLGEMQAAVQARDEILAIVSHDLRNPLAGVGWAAKALEPVVPQAQRRMLDHIQTATRWMSRLIRDLLDVTQLEAGRMSLELEPVALPPIVEELIATVRTDLIEKSIACEVDLAPGLPPVLADRDRLLQILGNLLGNAVKFTPRGGHVAVRATVAGPHVQVTVSDDGPGIAPDHLPHIFDRFWRARQGDLGGAGLGLAIARSLAEAHGGRLGVESELGRGSTFCLTLVAAIEAERVEADPALTV